MRYSGFLEQLEQRQTEEQVPPKSGHRPRPRPNLSMLLIAAMSARG